MIILISGKLVKVKPSVFRFSVLTQFIAKLVITPTSGWTDGGGLTRLYCTYFEYGYFIFEQNFVANKMGLIPPCPLLFINV